MKIVILPGWMQTSDHWKETVAQLEQRGHKVKVIDFPGFGKEPLVSNEWGVKEYAQWTKEKLKGVLPAGSTPQDKIILVGHSFGGRVAGYLAIMIPEQLSAAVLYASPNLYRPTQRTKTIKTLAVLARPLKDFLPQKFLKRFVSDDWLAAQGSHVQKVFGNIIGDDQTDLLKTIATPTLILWGEKDEAVPVAHAYEMNKLIPHSTLKVLPNLGHNIHLTNSNLLAATLDTYVETL